MVKPSSYKSFLMRRTASTSLRRYIRWPVLLLTGFNCGNSVSQKRRTYAGRRQSCEISPSLLVFLLFCCLFLCWHYFLLNDFPSNIVTQGPFTEDAANNLPWQHL